MAEPKPVINIGKFLEEQELEFSGVDEIGNYLVTNNEGRQGKFNIDKFYKSKGIDRKQVDYSFNSPDEPLDQSPVDITDRAALSLGNKAGSIDYLSRKFDGVKYNPEGELVVKKAGVWHRVDPESMGANPWEMTKELIADMADVAPTVGLVGASIGAGIATGGASLGAQAVAQGAVGGGLETLRTSLGRAVGTYKASAEEQVSDIALETLLNLGGTYAGAGIKWGGSKSVALLRKAGERLGKANPEGQGVIAGILGPATVGADNIQEMIKDPKLVTGFLDDALKAGKSEAEAAQHLVQGQVDDLVKIADAAPTALNKAWNQNVNTLMDQAADNFDSGIKDIRKSMFAQMLNEGIIRVEDKVGKRVGDVIVRPAIMSADDLMTKNLDDLNIRMFSYDELAKHGRKSGLPNKFANSKEAYSMMSELFETLQRNNLRPLPGKQGVKQLMSFKQTLASKTWELSKKAKKNDLGFASSIFTNIDNVMDSHVDQVFAHNKMGAAWSQLNAQYKAQRSFLNPLMEARERAIHSNTLTAFQPELNRILSAGAGNLANKQSLRSAVGLINNDSITTSFQNIYKRNAAKAFVPKFGPYAKVAGSAAVGSLVSGNPVMALGFAGSAIGTSPRLVGRALSRSAQGGALVEVGFRQLDFLKKMNPEKLNALVNSPPLLNSFLQTGAMASGHKEQFKSDLINSAIQSSTPVAPPIQNGKAK